MRPPGPDDPFTAMLRGGAAPTAVAGALAVIVGAVLGGLPSAVGAAVGAAVVGGTFLLTLVTMRVTRTVAPDLTLGAALLTYTTKAVALGLALVGWRDATWMSTTAFAITLLTCTLTWLAGQLRAFTRMRVLVHQDAR